MPGIGFRPAGSLTLAAGDAELALLKEAAALPDADRREFELLDPAAVRAVNPALRGEFAGGLFCRADAIVEPRQVLPALRGYCGSGRRIQWLPGREVTEIVAERGTRPHRRLAPVRPGGPVPRRGAHRGARGGTWPAGGVRRVRLQMMQTAPLAERITTALADGDSLRYYPAYDLPGRGQLPPQTAAAERARAQLLLVQRADGGLTIGDTHEYAEPFGFDLDEDAYDHLRGRAEALLGAAHPAGAAPLGRGLQRGGPDGRPVTRSTTGPRSSPA